MGRVGALGAEHRDAHAHVALTACQTRSEASRASGRSIMRAEAGLATVRVFASAAGLSARSRSPVSLAPLRAWIGMAPLGSVPLFLFSARTQTRFSPASGARPLSKSCGFRGGLCPLCDACSARSSARKNGQGVSSILRYGQDPFLTPAPKPFAVLPGLAACRALSLSAARFPLSSRAPIAPRGIRSEGWLACVAGAGGQAAATTRGRLGRAERAAAFERQPKAGFRLPFQRRLDPDHAAPCCAMPRHAAPLAGRSVGVDALGGVA